jgi:hypothetical protein
MYVQCKDKNIDTFLERVIGKRQIASACLYDKASDKHKLKHRASPYGNFVW